MENFIMFAVIGLLAGTAGRMFYPGREPRRVMGTLVIGMLGALAGGMASFFYWPLVEGQYQTGNLVMSLVGAMIAIVLGAGLTYGRSFGNRTAR